jgi:hypothetical protein
MRTLLLLPLALLAACGGEASSVHPGPFGPAECSDVMGAAASCAPLELEVEFGPVVVGRTSARELVLLNRRDTPVRWTAAPLAPPFAHDLPAEVELGPREARSIEVTFAPTAVGSFEATLAVADDELPLTGFGVEPALACEPTQLDFGDVPIGTIARQRLACRNATAFPLLVQIATAPPFKVSVREARVESGGALELVLSFTPAARGNRAGLLRLTSSDMPLVELPLVGCGTSGDDGDCTEMQP